MYCEDYSHNMLAVYITKMQHLGHARIQNKPIKYIAIEQTLPPMKCKMCYIYLNIRWGHQFFSGKYPYNTCSAFLSYIWVNTVYTSHKNNKAEQMDSQGINAHIMTSCKILHQNTAICLPDYTVSQQIWKFCIIYIQHSEQGKSLKSRNMEMMGE